MLRLIIIALVVVFVLTLIRAAAGLIRQAMLSAANAGSPSPGHRSGTRGVPKQGELKRDPVCGTFVATGSALQKTIGGEVVYFCSPECRDRYQQQG